MRKLLAWGWLATVFFSTVLIEAIEASADRHWADRVDPGSLSLRRQYNAVAAAVDTIMRQLRRDRVDELTGDSQPLNLLPNDAKVVLLFWADDEAELFLNGTPVSATRLTPTRVEIPGFYLRENNLLQAHCRDTDRVESGFMAGLYVEWSDGGMRPVVTTGEGSWQLGKGSPQKATAREILYTHTQPDIPEARVIWGEKLFGEVWLSVPFSAADVRAAGDRGPAGLRLPRDWGRAQPMDFHLSISRLVHLQEERRRLARVLEARHSELEPYLRFRGGHLSPIAYSLGKSEPLSEERKSVASSARLVKWVKQLPSEDRALVLGPARQLKGASAATPEEFASRSEAGREDRRLDYQPPRDLGAQRGRPATEVFSGERLGPERETDVLSLVAFGLLAAYTGAASHRWWKLFRGESAWKNAGA